MENQLEEIIQINTIFAPEYKNDIQMYGLSNLGKVYWYNEANDKWERHARALSVQEKD